MPSSSQKDPDADPEQAVAVREPSEGSGRGVELPARRDRRPGAPGRPAPRPDPVPVARSLHARPDGGDEILRPEPAPRRGDGRRDGGRGGRVPEPPLSAGRRRRRRGGLAGAPRLERRRAQEGGRAGAAGVGLPGRPSACPASPPGTACTQIGEARRRARRWWSRPPAARSAAWSASSPRSRGCRAVGIAGGADEVRLRDAASSASTPASTTRPHADPSRFEALKDAAGRHRRLFENVGGAVLDAVLARMNAFGRDRAVRHDRRLRRPSRSRSSSPRRSW